MKMNKFFAMALPLCVGALLAGCSDAAVEEEIAPAPAATTNTFTATIVNDDTRAYVSGEEQGYKVLWNEGDEMSFFPAGQTTPVKATQTGVGGYTIGSFTYEGSKPASGVGCFGVFPYNANDQVDQDGTIHTELPSVQTYKAGSHGGHNVYMVDYTVAKDDKTDLDNMQVYHSGLGLWLKGSGTGFKITIESKKEPLAGKVSIATPYGNEPEVTVTEGSNMVTFTCDNEYLTSEAKPFCVSLLSGTYRLLRVTITDFEGNQYFQRTASNITLRPGMMRMMNGTEMPLLDEAIDLSANETYANCYIVTKPGAYKFATKRVSGSDVSLKYTNGTDVPTAYNFDVVDWVWKTAGVELSDIKYENGYIYFTVENFVEGNASIGAFDTTTDPMHFLHNWHIWLTDQPEVKTALEGKAFMDRNLGAIAPEIGNDDPDSYGLLYQWGRKDPLYNGFSNSINGSPETNARWNTVTGSQYFSQWNIINSSVTSIASINDYPTAFMYRNVQYCGWCWASNNVMGDGFWNDLKTNYDPCPYGYKVPTGADLDLYIGYDGDLFGFEMEDGSFYLLPRQGYRWSKGSLVEGNNSIWVADSKLVEGSNNDLDYLGKSFIYTNANNKGFSLCDFSQAYPVRCVKE